MDIINLQAKSKEARLEILKHHHQAKTSHIGSSLSCIDILVNIYFNAMNDGDIVILSKGHATSALYTVLKMKGYDILTPIPGHPERGNGVFCSTGSLGHGLSIGCGAALADKNKKVYVVVSDGEMNEGSTWEAIMFAAHHSIHNLIMVIDNNHIQACGQTTVIMNIEPLRKKLQLFGWETVECLGNSHSDLNYAFGKVAQSKSPKCIIADTIKGYGVSFMENSVEWHYKYPDYEEYKKAYDEISVC